MSQHELTHIAKAASEPLHHHPPSPPTIPTYNEPPSSHASEAPSPTTISPKKLYLIIGSLYLGTFLVALDTTIINTALPAITTDFHALDDLAWYGSAYLLALTALQPTFGKLYKVFGIKMLYLASIALFEVGSIVCATAPSSLIFIIGRAVAGCGAAGLMQGAFAIVVKTVPLSRRPFYFGIFVSAFGVSIGVGPVLGGFFADRGMWRWCFWINLPLGIIVFLLVAMFLKLRKTDRSKVYTSCSTRQFLHQLDLGGSVLLIGSMCCLFTAMQIGGQGLPWTSPKIIGLFTGFGVLLALFLLVEWRMGEDASIPFVILRQRSIAFGVIYLLLSAMPNFSYSVYIPMYFQAARGFSAQRSGAELLFLALTQILVVVVVGGIVSRVGYYTPFIIVGTALSVVGSGLIISLNLSATHVAWASYFVICGLGTGIAINLPYTAVSTVLKEEDMVTGNALLQFTFQLGGALSLCISQTLFVDKLISERRSQLLDTSAKVIVVTGVSDLPGLASSSKDGYLLRSSYQSAVREVFIFLLVANGLAFLASFGFEHKNVRKVQAESKEEVDIVV
ncbi:MFS multidrug transporter-like protein [Ophiobolus disseminans]|uniref:MFS multidrug transporter-like protein n=1 Tax=Ophiobolus disseminans TaxID=1469910 RepID=A0A6A7A3V1_9PLEO|nr:MFS multidrug transporter-like protein [Ophiobolus disseminans]